MQTKGNENSSPNFIHQKHDETTCLQGTRVMADTITEDTAVNSAGLGGRTKTGVLKSGHFKWSAAAQTTQQNFTPFASGRYNSTYPSHTTYTSLSLTGLSQSFWVISFYIINGPLLFFVHFCGHIHV